MAKRYLFIPLLTATLLCMACDDPPVKTYEYQNGLSGTAASVTSGEFLGTYRVDSFPDLFNGRPFVISFRATDATSADNVLAWMTPLKDTVKGEEYDSMFRGTYSASTTGSTTTATISFTKNRKKNSYVETGPMVFLGTTFTFTQANGNTLKGSKIDDYLMQMDDDDYQGTARFLANSDGAFVDNATYQFCTSDGTGFFFPNDTKVCLYNVTSPNGETLTGTYNYKITANRIYIWNQGSLTYEDSPVAVFHYFITRAVNGGNTSIHNLWVNGTCYGQVVRTI